MAKVEIERKPKERFESLSTQLEGVKLRVEPGIKLDILRKTIDAFYGVARLFTKIKFQIDDLMDQQDSSRKEIIEVVKEHEGLRGLSSEIDNFVLTVIPREKVTWNRKLLQKSMGAAYSALVREDLVVTVSIPVVFVTQKKKIISEEIVEKTIRRALVNLGISQEDLARIMHQEVNITVDEEKLTEMVNQGQVKLPAGAKTSEISWAVRVDRLEK